MTSPQKNPLGSPPIPKDKIAELVNSGYCVLDSFLEESQTQGLRDLVDLLQQQQRLQPAAIGQGHKRSRQEQIRGDSILWFSELRNSSLDTEVSDVLHRFTTCVVELRQFLKNELRLSLNSQEIHFASYSPGQFYKRHVDQHRNGQRLLSFVFYLNRQWQNQDGGQLKLYSKSEEQQTPTMILPQFNRLVLFRSDIEHEVLATQRQRCAIVGWFRRSH